MVTGHHPRYKFIIKSGTKTVPDYLYADGGYVLYFLYMSLSDPIISLKFHASYGTHLLKGLIIAVGVGPVSTRRKDCCWCDYYDRDSVAEIGQPYTPQYPHVGYLCGVGQGSDVERVYLEFPGIGY